MNLELLNYYHRDKLYCYVTANYNLLYDDYVGRRGDGSVVCVKCFVQKHTRLFEKKDQLLTYPICDCWGNHPNSYVQVKNAVSDDAFNGETIIYKVVSSGNRRGWDILLK